MIESQQEVLGGWAESESATPAPDDEALMLRYREGDAAAFDSLYQRHRGGLYRYLLRQAGNRETAEELFQDVWMNLIRNRERYQPTARFTTYLYRMAHNRFIDHCRRAKTRNELSDDVPELADPAPPPDMTLSLEETRKRFLGAVANLPESQREVFLLRQETGLGTEEIARITGVNAETTKSRLRYAMNRLKQALRSST